MAVIRGRDISFKKYLEIGHGRKTFGDSPEHDFAGDALRDAGFRDFKKWQELEDYLLFNGAIPEAVDAAKVLFQRWRAGS